MAILEFDKVGISAMSAVVPANVIRNYEYCNYFNASDVKEIVDKIGVVERRFAQPEVCASDMCYAAAEKLIADTGINREEIDLLVFISQTPDYRMPATSVILQNRLQLSKSVMAFDINLGCSAFIYGLSVVFGLMQHSGLRKALILNGETRSKVYSPKDRKTAFIFGDAAVAALIERKDCFSKSYFSFHSDGSLEDLIKIPAGGYRNPSSAETVKERVVDEYGNMRSDEQGYMNGSDVFNFVIREVPRDIKALCEYAGISIDTPDFYIFHQANAFMNQYLVKKLKLDPLKVPTTLEKYGNTSSVSTPLTIVDQLKDRLQDSSRLMLCAFGVGMTWASAILNLNNCHLSDIVEI